MTDELTDIAGGDPRRAQVLRDCLTQFADGPESELRDMARAVLNGEIQLREAARSSTYGAAMGESFETFWARYRQLSPEERADLEASGREYLGGPD